MERSLFGPANKAARPAVQERRTAYRPRMTTWRTRLEPFTRPLFFAWSRASRGMTLGVRGVAVDDDFHLRQPVRTYSRSELQRNDQHHKEPAEFRNQRQ